MRLYNTEQPMTTTWMRIEDELILALFLSHYPPWTAGRERERERFISVM
jgi:hypothetical protein